MAYIEPKTTWAAGNIPVASDFNRIEGNTKQNHDDIVSEVADRATDEATLQANIDTEEAARIAADTTLTNRFGGLDHSVTGAGSFASGTNDAQATLAKGFYHMIPGATTNTSHRVVIQSRVYTAAGFYFIDNVNSVLKVSSTDGSVATTTYIKLA